MFSIYADGDLLWFQGCDEDDYAILDPILTVEVNKSGSLEFTLPTTNRKYSDLQKLKTTILVKEDDEILWGGRILHDEKDFYNSKKIYCEGVLSFLMDSVVRPYNSTESVEKTMKFYLDQHNQQVADDRKIHFGDVSVKDLNDYVPRSSTVYPKTLNEITEKLLNSYGGYLIIIPLNGMWFLDYKPSYNHICDQTIEFGENLLDVTEYINAENVFTVLIPLGAKQQTEDGTEGQRLTVKSVNNGLDYIENQTAINLFGRITSIYEWDDVTEPSNLLRKGQDLLKSNVEMNITLSMKAVDLHYLNVDTEKICVGDMVEVVSKPHGLDTYFFCSEIKYDLENPANNEYTFGTGFSAMTDQQVIDAKRVNSAYQTAQSASNTVSNMGINVDSNYVARSEFVAYQESVSNDFTKYDDKLTDVVHYKGSVSDVESLPEEPDVGDLYFITNVGMKMWDGIDWVGLQ